ncbi:MAG TPA: hypothetical protein VL485_08360 [Ktedonobacteraceae bacterium]|nr:hypothetical protein [Ktedonobacteraceae bacterium]
MRTGIKPGPYLYKKAREAVIRHRTGIPARKETLQVGTGLYAGPVANDGEIVHRSVAFILW